MEKHLNLIDKLDEQTNKQINSKKEEWKNKGTN